METWKKIPGWESLYEASTLGRIRSRGKFVRARNGAKAFRHGRVLKPVIKGGRYYAVTLADGEIREQFLVHSLVLLTFVGPRPDGMQGRHLDDDKAHNALANLVYGTPVENNADALRNGVKPFGERHGCARLTEPEVLAIRGSAARGIDLADAYGVHPGHISAIRHRKVWKHL